MLRRLLLAAAIALAPSLASAQFATIGPTPSTSDNGDRLATTAWVNSLIASGLTLASGKIWIGSAGNIATPQTPSGDCTLSLSGVVTCTQAAGNFLVNGSLTVNGLLVDGNGELMTNIVAPATPAAGTTRVYVDSTQKVLTFKNDAGVVGNAVVPSICGANLFGTSVSAAGVFGCAQPAVSNISGFGTGVATALGINVGSAGAFTTFNGAHGTPSSITLTNGTGLPTTALTGALQAAQEPAHTGDVTNTPGSLALAYANVVPASKGGAGTVSGALKGNGSGTVSQAATTDLSDVTAAGSWTPTDQSGAALSLTNGGSNFSKANRTCVGNFHITYPSTANGSPASVSLPCTLANNGNQAIGSCQTSASGANGFLSLSGGANSAAASFSQTTGLVSPTNANLTTAILECFFAFITN